MVSSASLPRGVSLSEQYHGGIDRICYLLFSSRKTTLMQKPTTRLTPLPMLPYTFESGEDGRFFGVSGSSNKKLLDFWLLAITLFSGHHFNTSPFSYHEVDVLRRLYPVRDRLGKVELAAHGITSRVV